MVYLLIIGLSICYLEVGLLVGRCCYTYWENHNTFSTSNQDGKFFSTIAAIMFWPVLGLAFGSYYFVTNGVRKKSKPEKIKRA